MIRSPAAVLIIISVLPKAVKICADSNYYIVIDVITPLEHIIFEWLNQTLVSWGGNRFVILVGS